MVKVDNTCLNIVDVVSVIHFFTKVFSLNNIDFTHKNE